MNPYSILAGLAVIASLTVWGTWERSEAVQARADFSTLKASYATAAAAAETHAQAVQAQQQKVIDARTGKALSAAVSATTKAEAEKAAYDAKLAGLAKQEPADLGHACASIPIPGDLIP